MPGHVPVGNDEVVTKGTSGSGGGTGTGNVTVVQGTGTSPDAVMSQKAVTDALATKQRTAFEMTLYGDGVTGAFSFNHGLNSSTPLINLFEHVGTSRVYIVAQYTASDANNVTVYFDVIPPIGATYTVKVYP